jgi:hypothetical protein
MRMFVYSMWEIIICEEYEVWDTNKGAAEYLSLLEMLHFVDWHIL